MTKLSNREKLLLYLLVVVLALVAGWFLIKPALEESAALGNEAVETAMQKTAVEQAIAGRTQYTESLAQSQARAEALEDEFLPLMTNDDLDRYITGILQRNGLVAESLLISASGDESVSLAVTKLFVRVTATGELDQIIALVEQLSGLKGIRISKLNVREKGEKILTVPLTPEEIEEQKAAAPTPAPKKKKAAAKDEAGVPVKEVRVMEYAVEFGFEVMEFDEAVFAAMGG